MDVLINTNATQARKKIHMSPPVPPSMRPIAATSRATSQEAIRMVENPYIEIKPKLRCHQVSENSDRVTHDILITVRS